MSGGLGPDTLGHAMHRHWHSIAAAVKHEDAPPIAAPEHGASSISCLDAGMCICSGVGVIVYALRNSLLRVLKQECPPKSHRRTLLVDGSVVLLFAAWNHAHIGDGPRPLPDKTLAAHVGLMYLSPFRPTYHVVCVQSKDDGHLASRRTVFVEVPRHIFHVRSRTLR
jgi:hypothetical protein